MVHDPMEPESETPELDPDAWLWVSGVNYVAGWREATDAAAELAEVLQAADVDPAGHSIRADSAADGTGLVRLIWPASTVRALAWLIRGGADGWRDAS